MSVVSETDRVLFTILSNPERVDLAALPEARIEEVSEQVPEPPRVEELPVVEETTAPPPLAYDPPPAMYDPPPPAQYDPPPPEQYDPLQPAAQSQPATHDLPPPTAQHDPPPPPKDDPSREEEDAKRTILLDLRRLEMQGVRLSKEWTMEDRLDDMMLEMRRHTLAMDETANVTMMRDGMRLLVTGIEMVNNRFGLLDLEGWSSEVCRDLGKHDANLSRIYRKYWRRSTSTSPEVDICMSLVGSMSLHHMKRKMSKHLMTGSSKGFSAFGRPPSKPPKRAPTPPSSDDEGPPP